MKRLYVIGMGPGGADQLTPQALRALEDSERKHSQGETVAYDPLQARYANYYAQGLWTKRYIALAVRKGRLTAEQFRDITGEAYDPALASEVDAH